MPAVRRASTLSLLVCLLLLRTPSSTVAQPLANPRAVEFVPSVHHDTALADGTAAVSSYVFEIYRQGAVAPFHTVNLGKPAPQGDGRVRYDFSSNIVSWPLPGGVYESRVAAAGPTGAARSLASNPFTMDSPVVPCTYTVSQANSSIEVWGGSQVLTVGAPAGCAWVTASASAWVTLSPVRGSGPGLVTLVAAPNPTASPRTASVTVAGHLTPLSQVAGPVPHTLTIGAPPRGTPSPSRREEAVSLGVKVLDSFSHSLKYLWQASCAEASGGGAFLPSAGAAAPTWRPPVVPAGEGLTCLIRVTVIDDEGLAAQAAYVQTVGAESGHSLTIVRPPAGTPNPVTSNGMVHVDTEVSDSAGHRVTYLWSATCPGLGGSGSFSSVSTSSTTWTAPANSTGIPQPCTFSVAVTDGQGLTAAASHSQTINPVDHAVTITAGAAGSPNPASSGGAVTLTVGAVDSLGHPLSYQWTSVCTGGDGHGSFAASARVQAPVWTAPADPSGAEISCLLRVVASDGQGPSAATSFTQRVSPVSPSKPVSHSLTITQHPHGTPNPASVRQPIALAVTAVDSWFHPLRYLWQAVCDAGTSSGTWSPSASSHAPSWTPPAHDTTEDLNCLLRVSVIDGDDLYAQASFMHKVTGTASSR